MSTLLPTPNKNFSDRAALDAYLDSDSQTLNHVYKVSDTNQIFKWTASGLVELKESLVPVRTRFGTRDQYNSWVDDGNSVLEAELAYITDEKVILIGNATGAPSEFHAGSIPKTGGCEEINSKLDAPYIYTPTINKSMTLTFGSGGEFDTLGEAWKMLASYNFTGSPDPESGDRVNVILQLVGGQEVDSFDAVDFNKNQTRIFVSGGADPENYVMTSHGPYGIVVGRHTLLSMGGIRLKGDSDADNFQIGMQLGASSFVRNKGDGWLPFEVEGYSEGVRCLGGLLNLRRSRVTFSDIGVVGVKAIGNARVEMYHDMDAASSITGRDGNSEYGALAEEDSSIQIASHISGFNRGSCTSSGCTTTINKFIDQSPSSIKNADIGIKVLGVGASVTATTANLDMDSSVVTKYSIPENTVKTDSSGDVEGHHVSMAYIKTW